RVAVLARGLGRAEEAVKADPRDAGAHFAVFCNLGKRLDMKRHEGGSVCGARRALPPGRGDRHRPGARSGLSGGAAAKGEMLVQLPRLLGGDPRQGERLLRRAVALDPDDPRTRLMLANISVSPGSVIRR